jgi:F420-non-reducing hydrogenase large subunit
MDKRCGGRIMSRTFKIDPVTRIEGHARIVLDYADNDTVDRAYMIVNELRGFERILVGMEADKMPQVTSRICGVCPTAHHLAAVKALDNAAGVEPPPAGKLLRELMYMGHFIHSHALSLFVLSGPDLFFGLDGKPARQNIVGIVESEPETAKKALRLRTVGQKINEAIGGRGVHPVTAVAGGMSYSLNDSQLSRLQELSSEAVSLINDLSGLTKELLLRLLDNNPRLLEKLVLPGWYLGTVKEGKLNLYDGDLRVIDEEGNTRTEFASANYLDFLVERAVPWSYMKEVYLSSDGKEHLYRVNTLARINVADGMETPMAQAEFETFRNNFGRPCHNTVLQIYARLIELIYACEKAQEIANNPELRGETRVPAKLKAGRGVAHVEAPRGVLIHDYEIDDRGIIRSANLIVATQQNYAAINESIRQGADHLDLKGSDEVILNALEFVVRCYDPCLSCATHAIGRMAFDVEILRKGQHIRRIRRY